MATFEKHGAYVLVDGQFGSTGKGLFASWLAHRPTAHWVRRVVSNAGPNSGHTFYTDDNQKIVLKQLPTFAAARYMMGASPPPVYLSAGAIIDPEILNREAAMFPNLPIYVHPNATIITLADKEAEGSGSIQAVAGTRQGVGAALARKVLRDPTAIAIGWQDSFKEPNISVMRQPLHDYTSVGASFFEVSQGYSLGINSQFYPKTTSRECTVAQALADAGMSPRYFVESYMVIRTYPIRVGNFEGFDSGGWYSDQEETSWEAIGQKPETTTVTGRIRRVASFSTRQYAEALIANTPAIVLVNFMNYMDSEGTQELIRKLNQAEMSAGLRPMRYYGFGPKHTDIKL